MPSFRFVNKNINLFVNLKAFSGETIGDKNLLCKLIPPCPWKPEVEVFNENEFYFCAIDKFRQNLILRIRILAICIRSTLIAIAINLKQFPLFCGVHFSEVMGREYFICVV